MLATTNLGEFRALAWYGLAATGFYYFLASLALRWRPRRDIRVTRYEPPAGISPAVAAYLWERGVSDKPLVVALANMTAKGVLKIEKGPSDYLISRGATSAPLEDEEDVIAENVFKGNGSSVCLSKLFRLAPMACSVRDSIESSVEPELISPHFAWLVPGFLVSMWSLLAALYPEIDGLLARQGQLILLPAIAAAWSVQATVKTLPAIFLKIKSRLPWCEPRALPFAKRDLMTVVMLSVAAASLGVIAWISSPLLALQFGVFLLLNMGGLLALRAPTSEGHRLLREMADFRVFLVQVDSDRVNRLNPPDATAPSAEKYWPWALALDVEHGWGEQFAAEVLNRLGPVAPMPGLQDVAPEDGRAQAEIIGLHLR
jgi:hypothetical protein